MLLYTTPAHTMASKHKNNRRNHHRSHESDFALELVLKKFNDKALNERHLRECARDNKQEKLKTILKKPDVDINAKDPFTFDAALHIAVDNNHLEIGKILLQEKNIDVNSQNCTRSTPLHLAISQDNGSYTELLLKHNAKTTIPNKYGKLPHYYIYPETQGWSPKDSSEEMRLNSKAHSSLLYSKLLPIHNEEKKAERIKWHQLHSDLLCERLYYLYLQQLTKELKLT
jgi:ankyrin repeat protein